MQKVIITSVIVLLSFSAMAQDKKVAVFQPAGNASNNIKEIVREQISSVIVNNKGYTVLERQLIDRVLKEQGIQVGGLVDESTAVKLGKLIGANFAFVTSISPLGRNLFISVKMIDVQTARIEKQNTGQTQSGTDDLINVVNKLTSKMLDIPIKVPDGKPVIVIGNFSGYKSEDWKNKTKEILINDKRFDVTMEQNSSSVRIAFKAYIIKATSKQTKKPEDIKINNKSTGFTTPEEIEVTFDIVDLKTGVTFDSKTVIVTIGKLLGVNAKAIDDFIKLTANKLLQ